MAASNESPAPAARLGAWTAPGGRFAQLYRSRWQPFLLLLALAGGALFVRAALLLNVPLPFCLLRRWTGIPCPGCGSTRSLEAWSHFQPLEALRLNPLFFALTLGTAAWAMAIIAQRWFGLDWAERSQRAVRRWMSTRLLLAVIVANWLYLWLTLPK